jgi:phage terminase large subunit
MTSQISTKMSNAPTKKQVKIEFNFRYAPLYQPKETKVFFGGRYSGKSQHFALALLTKCSGIPTRVLCAREYQTSIKQSVHRLLSDLIDEHDLHHIADNKDKNGKLRQKGKPGFIVTDKEIRHSNGSQFIFGGLKTNISNIKSMANVDICWVEEAENVSENSWSILIPTIRNKGAEIWISFNPKDESDATYQRFVKPYLSQLQENKVYEDGEIYVRQINFDENMMFIKDNKRILNTIAQFRDNDPIGYEHHILGKPVGQDDNTLIPGIWFDAAIDAHKTLNFQTGGINQVGYDPADGGNDAQSYIHRSGTIVKHISKLIGVNVETGCSKVYQYCLDNHIDKVIYDGIGIGTGARVEFNRLDPSRKIKYSSFIASESPRSGKYIDGRDNTEVFRNLRAQGYWDLRNRFYQTYRAIHQGIYIDPNLLISIDSSCEWISELRKELTQIQRKQNTDKITIESKQDMKNRGNKSPNIADALMYAMNDAPKEREILHIEFDTEW